MKKVSIIILNWNGKKFLEGCLNSIKKNTICPDYEVIVVDQGSRDGSIELMKKKFRWAKLIGNRENVGFSEGNNQGFRAAKGEYLFMLNNDTEVTKEWLRKAVEVMESDKRIASVGCNENERIDRGIFAKDVLTVSGATMLIRRDAMKRIGMLDSRNFSPIYGEETDWNYRARNSGYRVVQTGRSVIKHFSCQDTTRQISPKKQYVLCNTHRLKAMLYNLSLRDFLSHVPGLGLIFVSSITNNRTHWLLESYWNNFKDLGTILRERRKKRKKAKEIKK